MLKHITLGQYFPGDSVLHKIDPRMKIIIVSVYIAAIFTAKSVYTLAVIVLSVMILTFLSKISALIILKSLKPLLFLMIFTSIINIFWTDGDTLLFKYGIIKIYSEGVFYAVTMLVRITALVASASLFITYTTSPTALTDALERLLSPLKKIKVPVHEFAMMMTIALRFIPTLIDETDKIMNAQKARGANFETGSLLSRAKALIPVMIPLIISAFRRADELATAMECRCYRGGEGRTKMKQLRLEIKDIAALVIGIAFFVFMLVLQRL